MKVRNALGDAYLAAYQATDKIAEITLYLDITSERPQLDIDERQRAELYRMFRELRWAILQAEMVVDKVLTAQPPVQHAEPAVRSRRAKGRAA